MTVKVPLSRGLFCLIDDNDAERVLRYYWHAVPGSAGKAFYARSGRSWSYS